MDKKTSNTLLTIASLALAFGGLILLLISIFGDSKDNWTLNFALMAIILANLFNLIRLQRKRMKKQNSEGEKEFEKDHHE